MGGFGDNEVLFVTFPLFASDHFNDSHLYADITHGNNGEIMQPFLKL